MSPDSPYGTLRDDPGSWQLSAGLLTLWLLTVLFAIGAVVVTAVTGDATVVLSVASDLAAGEA